MKTQKLNFESFTLEKLTRNEKITILGKASTEIPPEIDEDGNLLPPPGTTPPGGGTGTNNGDGKP